MAYVRKTHQVRGKFYWSEGYYEDQLLFSGSLEQCEVFLRDLEDEDYLEWTDVRLVERKKKAD